MNPRLLILLTGALFLALPGFAEDPDEDYSGKPRWWWTFTGPSKRNPEDQYQLAQERLEKKQVSKAAKALDYLVNFWPESSLAPQAQLQLAQLYQEQGKLKKAFDAYQYLITRYAGEFPYDEVVEQQYQIARVMEDERVGDILFLPGFAAPEKAIPFYQQIVTNAPQWVRASECQHRIGELYHHIHDYRLAIKAFERTVSRYPDTVMAEESAFGKTQCLMTLAQERPNDDMAAENAWASLTLYLEQFKGKNPEHLEVAFEQMRQMRRRLARSFYEKARYYDEIARNERAALISYQAMVEEFPDSEWTSIAKSRIETLSRNLEEE